MDGQPSQVRLSPPWRMELWEYREQLKGRQYYADIFREGELACRMSISTDFPTYEAAQAHLAVRVRQWIVEFEQRPRPVALPSAHR